MSNINKPNDVSSKPSTLRMAFLAALAALGLGAGCDGERAVSPQCSGDAGCDAGVDAKLDGPVKFDTTVDKTVDTTVDTTVDKPKPYLDGMADPEGGAMEGGTKDGGITEGGATEGGVKDGGGADAKVDVKTSKPTCPTVTVGGNTFQVAVAIDSKSQCFGDPNADVIAETSQCQVLEKDIPFGGVKDIKNLSDGTYLLTAEAVKNGKICRQSVTYTIKGGITKGAQITITQ